MQRFYRSSRNESTSEPCAKGKQGGPLKCCTLRCKQQNKTVHSYFSFYIRACLATLKYDSYSKVIPSWLLRILRRSKRR